MVVSRTGSSPTPFGFAGTSQYQTDTESGLQLLGHRYYDPSTGRFITQDPARDGENWYAYCGNGPLSRLDPSGTSWKSWVIGGIVGIGVGVITLNPVAGVLAGTATGTLVSKIGEGNDWHEAINDGCISGLICADVVPIAIAIRGSIGIAIGSGSGGGSSGSGGSGGNTGSIGSGDPTSGGNLTDGGQIVGRIPTAKLRKMWEAYYDASWPTDPTTGKNLIAHHDTALADGGTNDPWNIIPMLPQDHILLHQQRGDFIRWGGRRGQ